MRRRFNIPCCLTGEAPPLPEEKGAIPDNKTKGLRVSAHFKSRSTPRTITAGQVATPRNDHPTCITPNPCHPREGGDPDAKGPTSLAV